MSGRLISELSYCSILSGKYVHPFSSAQVPTPPPGLPPWPHLWALPMHLLHPSPLHSLQPGPSHSLQFLDMEMDISALSRASRAACRDWLSDICWASFSSSLAAWARFCAAPGFLFCCI